MARGVGAHSGICLAGLIAYSRKQIFPHDGCSWGVKLKAQNRSHDCESRGINRTELLGATSHDGVGDEVREISLLSYRIVNNM
jgi:hypothetical protein